MSNTLSKKKILYIHHGKGIGGAPLSLLYLIQHLDKSIYDPIVLFLHDSPTVQLYKQNNIAIAGIVNRYDFPHTAIWWQRWYQAPMLAKVTYDTFTTLYQDAPFWLVKIKPDLVHLNTSSLIAWGKAAYKLAIPVVWHIREPLASGYLGIRNNIVRHHVQKYASAIIAISHNEAKPWKDNAKTSVIYNAVDSNKFNYDSDSTHLAKELNMAKNEPKILFLGGLSKEKGTLVILKAFEQLLKQLPTAKLLIAGYFDLNFLENKKFSPSSNFYQKIKSIYDRTKQNIRLLGAIQHIPQVMHFSDILVFPATVGHFARPIIEAGFMKKPVIASWLSPLDELVLDTKTGFLIDPNNLEAWNTKLYQLLTNKKLAQELGENNYSFCKKNFDITDQIKKIEKIYNNLLCEDPTHYEATTA